jgi:hypothetical protein
MVVRPKMAILRKSASAGSDGEAGLVAADLRRRLLQEA